MIMLPNAEYLRVLEHGKNLGRKEVINELQARLSQLEQMKGIGPAIVQRIYEALEIKFKDK
jgi:DNA uptake protein ComE-like DNA-binding protein